MKAGCVLLIVAGIALPAASVRAGEMDVTPYGFVLINGVFNDHIATDIPVKAALADSGDSRTSTTITARQTRFGLKVKSEAEGWTIRGIVELDFWGRKGSGPPAASMQSAPRMRLANFSLRKKNLTLTFGQDWTIFAPLLPTSLAHQSIVVFSSSGNLWNRTPQVRIDYRSPTGDGRYLLIQIAVIRPLGADVTNDGQPETLGAGEYSGLPFGQARVAFQGQKFTIGVSAHGGQEDWRKAYPDSLVRNKTAYRFTDDKTSTWAVAGDLKVDAGTVGFSAEGYVGSNLNMLFSNAAVQFVPVERFDPPPIESPTLVDVEGINVLGGWGQIAIKPPNSKVKFHAGAGIEILNEDQVKEMAAAGAQLFKNMTVFGNVFYSPLPRVTFALEIGYIKTTYKVDSEKDVDGTNLNIGTAFKLAF